jgi:hypothetical protein
MLLFLAAWEPVEKACFAQHGHPALLFFQQAAGLDAGAS